VNALCVVVGDVFAEQRQMVFVQHHDVIEKLPANGAHETPCHAIHRFHE